MPVVKHPHSIVFSHQNVPPIMFCRDFMVSCEISSPSLQLLSLLGPRRGIHRSPSQAPRLVGQLSHSFVFFWEGVPFGSLVVSRLSAVSAPCCPCCDSCPLRGSWFQSLSSHNGSGASRSLDLACGSVARERGRRGPCLRSV